MSQDESARDDAQPEDSGTEGTPPLERLIGAVGGVLVLALLAFLGFQAIAAPDDGVNLTAAVTRIEPAGEQFATHVRVENDGHETAAAVTVAGEVQVGAKTAEEATATISYLPAQSVRHAVLVFTQDPRDAKLSVRAAGYALP